MFFKHGDGTFSSIDVVVVQWDQLDVHLVGSDVLVSRLGALIVHHGKCWLVITSTENPKHFEEGSDEQGIGAGWHWLHNNGIEFVDVQ